MEATIKVSCGFDPFSTWQCPHCQRSYKKEEANGNGGNDVAAATATTVLFLRGTCRHDVCAGCIANLSSLLSRRVKSEESVDDDEKSFIMTVTCPIITNQNHHRRRCSSGRICQGLFHVDLAQIMRSLSDRDLNTNKGMVIDLCDDDDDDDDDDIEEKSLSSDVDPGNTKRKSGDRIRHSSERCIVSIKEEVIIQPEQVLSTCRESFPLSSSSATTPTVTKPHTPSQNSITVKEEESSNLKPLFEEGDEVVAAWWDPVTDAKRRKEFVWHPGKVISYKIIEDANTSSKYGPTRLYDIMYDEGGVLDNIEDYHVFSKTDYELTAKFEETSWIGVRKQLDGKSSDMWAKKVGWYEITGDDGKVQSFSKLTDAMRAHDAMVVGKHGARTKRSFLNIPEDHEYLFPLTNLLSSGKRMIRGVDVVDARSTRQESTNIVSPERGSIVRMKIDPNSHDEKIVFHGENKADTHEGQEVKRQRVDELWSGNLEHIQFTEQAFMNNSLFHLNSFIQSKGTVKLNEAFSEFIREGLATPGFSRVPETLGIEKINDLTYFDLRDVLIKHGYHDKSGASQTAMWLKNASIGSFVIMRHEYKNCPFCPNRLIGDDGKYIGPVYVIGVITKKVVPWSEEEWDIENNKMGEFSRGRYPIHTVCKIDWKRMGYKDELEESTQNYINHVCQPTLTQICKPGKVFACGTSSERIRNDLWRNATEQISSEDFPDEFEHKGEDDC